MDERSNNLYGSAPDKSAVAILLIDVINDLDFEGSESLVKRAMSIAPNLADLAARARSLHIPVIYVNDNFGRWRSDFHAQVEHCLNDDVPGAPFVVQLKPTQNDYFVLKPKHSGFYSTVLDILLEHLQVQTLVIAGIATNICVLFTANDAYMRDYAVVIPEDGVASDSESLDQYTLNEMRSVLKADICKARDIDLAGLQTKTRSKAARMK